MVTRPNGSLKFLDFLYLKYACNTHIKLSFETLYIAETCIIQITHNLKKKTRRRQYLPSLLADSERWAMFLKRVFVYFLGRP